MNIIIPLGGIGKRFYENGYTKPKPLIKVLGKEILFWLLDSLQVTEEDYIYIPYNEYLDSYNFEEIINKLYPNIKLVSLPPTNGPSETLKLCITHFNLKGHILVMDGDTWYEENIVDIIRKKKSNLTTYFNTNTKDPIYSFIEIENNKILNIAEKVKISNCANTGCYSFLDADEVLFHINNIEKKSEQFISDIINEMLKNGVEFTTIKVEKIHVLGTPHQIVEFSSYFPIEPKRFVFDLDNTLVTYPKKLGDYTSVEPIHRTINYLRNLKNKGHYIIIYTARKMRTYNGNLGLVFADIAEITIETLKKFNIPYDELFFGKPYAHFYIDDLMINPVTDLNKELGFYLECVEPRHFNQLTFYEDCVIKKSNYKKIEGESYYYNEIHKYPEKKYFPILFSKTENEIVIEHIKGINYSILYLNEILTKNHIDMLFDTINEIHNSGEFPRKKFTKYYDYTDKITNRFELFDFSSIGMDENKQQEILNLVKDINGILVPIHGDLVFSNIILTKNEQLKFIDVKGKLGNDLTIYGHALYDYAKIYQSLIGYDEILLDKKINKKYKQKMIEYFESKFISKENDLILIKKITKTLLVTLIPLHNEPKKFKKYLTLSEKI